MGIISNLKFAKRSLTRRKSKNISAVLAIALGVTLMVGIQITTATLEETFVTSLLVSQGEVDLTFTSGTTGGYLSSADKANITALIQETLGTQPPGVMGSLKLNQPILIGAQYESSVSMHGLELNYPEVFGSFYDWKTGDELEVASLLEDNSSILFSSNLAEVMDITEDTTLPVVVTTQFNELKMNMSDFSFYYDSFIEEFNVVGIFDSNRPGIGASMSGFVINMDQIQYLKSLQLGLEGSRNTDILDSYVISLKGDHFNNDIDYDYLKSSVEALSVAVPFINDPENPESMIPYYAIMSERLLYRDIIDFMFVMLNAFLTALGLLIVATGLLLITNIQLMAVEDREFQTGVMRAVGEKRLGIFVSNLVESIFQGVFGGLIGLLGGFGFGWLVAFYLADLFQSGSMSVTPVFQESVILFSVMVGLMIAILTGILPSLRASRVNIVEALRGIKTEIQDRSSRNYYFIGIFLLVVGIYVILKNGVIDTHLDGFWLILEDSEGIHQGYDTIREWENILLGGGFLFSGIGIILSNKIDRTKAMNITALALWFLPFFVFNVGFDWVEDTSIGDPTALLIYAIIELIIGSVLLVGLNLVPLMRTLRSIFIRFRFSRGVAQISPALISSHKTRSTLTFAIFAVILTLNVTVATMVETSFSGSVGQANEESRGVDIFVQLNPHENISLGHSYTDELYKIDDRIEDVIPFRTTDYSFNTPNLVSLSQPGSANWTDYIIPFRYIETKEEQIKGNAPDASSEEPWRYDFYLDSFPDGLREEYDISLKDEKALDLSKRAWDQFFNISFTMSAYNVSSIATSISSGEGFDFSSMAMDQNDLDDELRLSVSNPIVFTDSFFLPLGIQIWIPMNHTTVNGSDKDVINYQSFTVAGSLDSQRAGGFPLGPMDMSSTDMDFSSVITMGSIFISEYWTNKTTYFGNVDPSIDPGRKSNEYDSYLVKTSLAIDDPGCEEIAIKIEEFTNTAGAGYRELTNTVFITASATTIYSGIKATLAIAKQFTNFLQIYVSFGLVIGAVGMGVISVRNVAERKREIGMMRAIGFPRGQVILSVLLELFVLGIIGLIIGIANGLVVTVGVSSMQNAPLVIPWDTIAIYLGFITLVALVAGALPGISASRIPPSEALRYVG